MGRKSTFSFYIDDALRSAIKKAADLTGLPQSQIIRSAIQKEVEKLLAKAAK